MFNETYKFFGVLRSQNSLVLDRLEHFVNGALIQIERVKRTQTSLVKVTAKPKKMTQLFLDAHTYFICIGQIDKFFRRLCDDLQNPALSALHAKFAKAFSKEIRNDLEHLDERAIGQKFGKKKTSTEVAIWHQDFVNFVGDKLTFGGKAYPVNAAAAAELKVIYRELITILRRDYGLKDQYFVQSEAREKETRRIQRFIRSKTFRKATGQSL